MNAHPGTAKSLTARDWGVHFIIRKEFLAQFYCPKRKLVTSLFDFMRARKKRVSGDLVFKDNVSAFEYACKYFDHRIVEGQCLVALVREVESLRDGRQSCNLLLESDDGGRELLLCDTLNQQVPRLRVGDLVTYKVAWHLPQSKSKIAAASVMGFIVAKLEPAWSIEGNGWKIWSRPNPIVSENTLLFRNNNSAFEYACENLDSRIVAGRTLAALVKEVETLHDGRQCCTLLLQSNEGGRELLLCEALNQQIPKLKVGDLVAYRITNYFPESKSKIAAVSVMGFIVDKYLPNWSIQENCWWEDLTAR